jgi:hypothetical protein
MLILISLHPQNRSGIDIRFLRELLGEKRAKTPWFLESPKSYQGV